jgi:hypothetical protein
MWSRLKRRSFGPRRPARYPDQIGLALLTALVIVAPIVVIVLSLRG